MNWFWEAVQAGAAAGATVAGFVITVGGIAGVMALVTLALVYAFGPPETPPEGNREAIRHDADKKQPGV